MWLGIIAETECLSQLLTLPWQSLTNLTPSQQLFRDIWSQGQVLTHILSTDRSTRSSTRRFRRRSSHPGEAAEDRPGNRVEVQLSAAMLNQACARERSP